MVEIGAIQARQLEAAAAIGQLKASFSRIPGRSQARETVRLITLFDEPFTLSTLR